jgi:microcin C transport system substrate-binding protein
MDLPELGSPEAKKGGTLRGGMSDFPRTFRHIGPDANGSFRTWLTDISVSYAHRHPNVEGYFPGIAKEWAIVPDERTVYVRIDPEATWSDGEPITSDDAMFGFYFRQSPDNNAPWYNNFFKVQYEKITRYDELTFAITVAEKKPDFFQYVLEDGPEPEHFYKGFGPEFVRDYQWRVRPTSGAYVIDETSIKKGRSLALKRVTDWWAKDRKYWKNRYNPDRIQMDVIRDPDKAFEAFKKGDLDVARLNLAKYNYEQLPDNDPLVRDGYIHKVTFYNDVPTGGIGLWINTSKPLLDNIDIRKGIGFACNWDLVIDKFFRGDWERENSTATGYGDLSHPTQQARPFSIEKAQEHFAKAGFTKRGADGILMNEQGQRLSFTITTGYKTMTDLLTILEQEARKAGLEFKLEVLDSTSGWKKSQEKKHEITLTGFSFSVTEIYPRYWETWHGDNAYDKDGSIKAQTNNYTLLNDPKLNELIDTYRSSESHEEKVRLAHQMEEMIFDSGAYVYGVYLPFYRVGFWRWILWPEDFNVKRSEIENSFMLHWIDEDMKEETLESLKSGKTYDPVVRTYDQYKRK